MLKFKSLICLFFALFSINVFGLGIDLKDGDLIFQESCSSSVLEEAIKDVTQSAYYFQFTHVGIVYISPANDSIFVIEATIPEVRMVSLDEFLLPKDKQCKPISVVGRIVDEYADRIPAAIDEAILQIGKEYDYGFVLDNDKYYCSEFIYDIFQKANGGSPIFQLNRMTFKQEDSTETDPNWVEYFESKGLNIPEGELGINPGAMSRSDVVMLLDGI